MSGMAAAAANVLAPLHSLIWLSSSSSKTTTVTTEVSWHEDTSEYQAEDSHQYQTEDNSKYQTDDTFGNVIKDDQVSDGEESDQGTAKERRRSGHCPVESCSTQEDQQSETEDDVRHSHWNWYWLKQTMVQ